MADRPENIEQNLEEIMAQSRLEAERLEQEQLDAILAQSLLENDVNNLEPVAPAPLAVVDSAPGADVVRAPIPAFADRLIDNVSDVDLEIRDAIISSRISATQLVQRQREQDMQRAIELSLTTGDRVASSIHTEEDEENLRLALQMSFEGAGNSTGRTLESDADTAQRNLDNDFDRDLAQAMALSSRARTVSFRLPENGEGEGSGSGSATVEAPDERIPALEAAGRELQEIIASPACNDINVDAHTYTRTLIRNGLLVLTRINDELFPDTYQNSEVSISNLERSFMGELSRFTRERSLPEHFNRRNCDAIFDKIKQYAGNLCPETGISPAELLIRTYLLARDAGQDGAKIAIMGCLSDNTTDAGGCIPGIVARLYPIYAQLLKFKLDANIAELRGEDAPRVRLAY